MTSEVGAEKSRIMQALLNSKCNIYPPVEREYMPEQSSMFWTEDDNDPMVSVDQCVWSSKDGRWLGPPNHHTQRLRKMSIREGRDMGGRNGFGEFDVTRKEYWRELAGVHTGWLFRGMGHGFKANHDQKLISYWEKSIHKFIEPIENVRSKYRKERYIVPEQKVLGIMVNVLPTIYVGKDDKTQDAMICHMHQKDGRVTWIRVNRNGSRFYDVMYYTSEQYLERILVAGRMLP